MVNIELKNVIVDFPIYNANTRSLKILFYNLQLGERLIF